MSDLSGSQASAVSCNKQSWGNDISKDQNDLQEDALFVGVWLGRLIDVHGGTGANLAISRQTHESGVDKPGESKGGEQSVQNTDRHSERHLFLHLGDHFNNCDKAADQGQVETIHNHICESLGHVFALTRVGLLLIRGKAIPVIFVSRTVVVEVPAEDSLSDTFEAKARPCHLLGEEFLHCSRTSWHVCFIR